MFNAPFVCVENTLFFLRVQCSPRLYAASLLRSRAFSRRQLRVWHQTPLPLSLPVYRGSQKWHRVPPVALDFVSSLHLSPNDCNTASWACSKLNSFGREGKFRYGSFQSWVNSWVPVKTVRFLDNACHTWALLWRGLLTKKRYIKHPLLLVSPLPLLWTIKFVQILLADLYPRKHFA